MASKTSTHYSLPLPQADDVVDISEISGALDTLDAELYKENTRAVAKENQTSQDLTGETNRATAAEQTLSSNLTAEINRATEKENTLNNNLSSEITRAKGAEQTIQSNLTAEKSRATDAEDALTKKLDEEIARAKKAEETNSGNASSNSSALSDEVTRAKAAEKANTDSISAEVARAKGVENGLVKSLSVSGRTITVTKGDDTTSTLTTQDTTYSTGTASTSGLTKLYTATGTNTDGTLTQKAVTDALGTKADSSTVSSHTSDASNPHKVTKAQVGLGNVDNTSDANKPISTATQTALDKKQDSLTTAQLSAVNSGATTDTINQIALNTQSIENLTNSALATVITNYYALRRTGKEYSVQIPKYASNTSSTCTKIGINADLNYEPSTDTVEGKDDYADIPMFQWVHCVYKRYSDSTAYPIAIEGTKEYDDLVAGGACDVGAMQMEFYVKIDTSNEAYDVLTLTDLPKDGFTPWVEGVKANGTVLPWCIGSAYISGIGTDGLLHSLPDIAPANNQCYNNMITNYQKKGEGYWGAGMCRHSFQYLFYTVKGGTKNSQNLYAGCSNYNIQAKCAVAETGVKRVLVASSANFVAGSSVEVGTNANSNIDRGDAGMYDLSKGICKITSIENVTIDSTTYKALNLDVKNSFDTTTDCYVSTMEWYSGSTDCVIGHHDGSRTSNTNGIYPYRVQGREYMVGGYEVASDTVLVFQSDYSKDVYVYPKGVAHVANSYENAVKVGNIPNKGEGLDYLIGDVSVDLAYGAICPSTIGSATNLGMGDYVWSGGKNTSGTREYLIGGNLGDGSYAGFSYVYCRHGLDWAYWACAAAD